MPITRIKKINQLEELIKSYLSNPIIEWGCDTPYVLTSTELLTVDDVKESMDSEDEPIILRVDVESVLYDTIETFIGTHIVAQLYNTYLRASMSGLIDEREQVDDYKLKNVTDTIIRYMTNYKGFNVYQEGYLFRDSAVSEHHFNENIVLREDYTCDATFKDNYPFDIIGHMPYPYNAYQNIMYVPDGEGMYIIGDDTNFVYGWLVCSKSLIEGIPSMLPKLLFRGETAAGTAYDKEKKGWWLFSPVRTECTYLESLDEINDIANCDIVVTNLLLQSNVNKISLINTIYQFIDDDDIGREIRNESLLSVRVST